MRSRLELLMPDPLSEVIRLRVTYRQKADLEQAAAAAGLSPSDYLRRRLVAGDGIADELAQIRQAIARLEAMAESQQQQSHDILQHLGSSTSHSA